MPSTILGRVFSRFASGILHTTYERWIDGGAVAVTALYQLFVQKPSTVWEGIEPYVWLLCFLFAVHVVKAIREVWQEIKKQPTVREVESPILLQNAQKRKTLIVEPRPPFFRSRLTLILLIALALLILPSYCIRLAAISSARTYIYLVPTAELMNCEKRAFFVKLVGPHVLYNVEVNLRDNKSGKTYSETYQEVDPRNRSANLYLWVTPSILWDEEYTATISARESQSSSSQQLVVRSTQHQIQFAMQIVVDDEKKPVVSCRDNLLPPSYTLAAGERRPCLDLMKLPGDVPIMLDVDSYQRPDGQLVLRRSKELPSPSELDEQSDDRHLTEYQQQLLTPIIDKHAGSTLVIYYAGGDRSKAYASEFYSLFHARQWKVGPPRLVPIGNERIIDVQMSVNYKQNWNKYNPRISDISDAFKKAGIKQSDHPSLDPNVPPDWIVLWLGPQSPKNVSPNQCVPPQIKQRAGEHHTCEMVSQGTCFFPPK